MPYPFCAIGFVLGVICAFLSGNISSSKGRSYVEGFVLGLLFGIIGLLVVVVLPRNESALAEAKLAIGTNRKCPYCAELIKAEAIVCRYCGKDLPPIKTIVTELKEIADQSKSEPSKIANDEMDKWHEGFSKIGWVEEIGQRTQSVLSDSPQAASVSKDDLLCVTYADVQGSRFTELMHNQTNFYSRYSALIATANMLIFVQPDRKLVETLEYKDIREIDREARANFTVYQIHSVFGDTVRVSISYGRSHDETIVNSFFDRIESVT